MAIVMSRSMLLLRVIPGVKVLVEVPGTCYYEGPFGCLWSGLPPEAMCMSEHCAELAPPQPGQHKRAGSSDVGLGKLALSG